MLFNMCIKFIQQQKLRISNFIKKNQPSKVDLLKNYHLFPPLFHVINNTRRTFHILYKNILRIVLNFKRCTNIKCEFNTTMGLSKLLASTSSHGNTRFRPYQLQTCSDCSHKLSQILDQY